MASLPFTTKAAFRLQQLALLANATAVQETVRLVTRQPRPKIDRETLKLLKARRDKLLRTDLANVADGHYPQALLFNVPYREYARQFGKLVAETPRLVRRKKEQRYDEVPAESKGYPHYYRRTFHWQSDGYFSLRSAEIYDIGVELLFRGTANQMRRQVLPPLTKEFAKHKGELVIADIASGTGNTLQMIRAALPNARLHGIDLSPHYCQYARARLPADIVIEAANAEAMPYASEAFDAMTCVYLFHELPRAIRRRVLGEALRCLKPGGLLVIEDSAQLSDSPELGEVLAGFPQEFHEPFYAEYLSDDLAALCNEVGFTVESSEPHLVAKVVVARKPNLPNDDIFDE